MTQVELRALGERWKACPGFRWRPGMAYLGPWPQSGRVLEGDADYLVVYGDHDTAKGGGHHEYDAGTVDFVPDVSDPATRGVLLEDVRERLGRPHLIVETRGRKSRVAEPLHARSWWAGPWVDGGDVGALVCAREAAPR